MGGWLAPDRRDIELSPHKKLVVEGLVFPSKAGKKPFKTADGPGGAGFV
jgi:hypothetical protein